MRIIPTCSSSSAERGCAAYPLTVLADLPDDARAMREEPFGPLALINPVASLDDAIGKANALPYGLAAYALCRT
jgi:succinate-semialdehyde dehydrogenase / glutarate-semialdehyde dehydrogenase